VTPNTNARQHVQHTRTAFTLTELMAVMAILGVLAILIVPRVSNHQVTSKRAACYACQGDIELQTKLHNQYNHWPRYGSHTLAHSREKKCRKNRLPPRT
jgi:prepilin-type N-terminal cleavage/methylation domain-containing protein